MLKLYSNGGTTGSAVNGATCRLWMRYEYTNVSYSTLKAGKRTREWARRRAKLKVRFERVGITRCEFGYLGCWRWNGLSFAHAEKRRFLKGDQLDVVTLACASCHPRLEAMPHEKMKAEVERVISERTRQP